MDYSNLIAELQNANKNSESYLVNQKLGELTVYLLTLQETGNYVIALKAMEEWWN